MTSRLTVRSAQPDDAAAIHGIYAPIVRDTVISFEWQPPTVVEMRGRIVKTAADDYPWLVAEDDGAVVGYAYASRFRMRDAYDWTAEVSVYVHPHSHRRGVGRTVYGALLRVLEAQGYRAAYGVAAAPNPGSEGLHRALGFEQVGRFPNVGWKFDAWHDVIVWRIGLGAASEAPGPRRTPAEVLSLL